MNGDYLPGRECALDHGGNRRLVQDSGYAVCQGCGRAYSLDPREVDREQVRIDRTAEALRLAGGKGER